MIGICQRRSDNLSGRRVGDPPSSRSPASERRTCPAAQLEPARRNDSVPALFPWIQTRSCSHVGATRCPRHWSGAFAINSIVASVGATARRRRPVERSSVRSGCQRRSDNLSAAGIVARRCRFDAGKRAHPRVVPLGGAPRLSAQSSAPRLWGLPASERQSVGCWVGSSLSLRRWQAGTPTGGTARRRSSVSAWTLAERAMPGWCPRSRRCRSDAGRRTTAACAGRPRCR